MTNPTAAPEGQQAEDQPEGSIDPEVVAQVEALISAFETYARDIGLQEARRLIRRESRRLDDVGRAYLAEKMGIIDEPDGLEKESPHGHYARRYLQWALASSDLPGTLRTMLMAVTHRMGSAGAPAYPSIETLAADASLGSSTVYTLLRRAESLGIVSRSRVEGRDSPNIAVTLEITYDQRRALHRLWTTRRSPQTPEELGSDDPDEEHVDVDRREWERAVRDARLTTPTKGVAWAIAQLSRRDGTPFRMTSWAELSAFSGYHQKTTVPRSVSKLEDAGWIRVTRKRGRRGGIVVRLTYPAPLIERFQLARILGGALEQEE